MIDRFNLDFNSMVSHPNDGDWVCWEDYEELQNRFSSLQSRLESLEKDAEFLSWCADRFVHVYGESEYVDFVLKLRSMAAMQANKGE